MRFNDLHKQLSAALQFDAEDARKWRPFMLRCWNRGLSANATLALLKLELAREKAEAQVESRADPAGLA